MTIKQPVPKGQCFIEHLLFGEELGWAGIGEGLFKSEKQAAKRVGELLDENPDRIFRIRNYLGSVVWQSPPPDEGDAK